MTRNTSQTSDGYEEPTYEITERRGGAEHVLIEVRATGDSTKDRLRLMDEIEDLKDGYRLFSSSEGTPDRLEGTYGSLEEAVEQKTKLQVDLNSDSRHWYIVHDNEVVSGAEGAVA